MTETKEEVRRIFLYSDLHLGGPEGMNFQVDDAKFVTYLKKRQSEGTIVFNGDIYDLYETKVCCDTQMAKYERICQDFPLTTDYIKQGNVIYISGNHDDLGSIEKNKELGSIPELTVKIFDKTLHFEHGHKYDNNLSYQGCCRCCCLPKGYRCFGSFLTLLCCVNTIVDSDYPQIAANYMRENKDVDLLVFGHTHEHMIIEVEKGRYYANTGCGCGKKNQFYETVVTINSKTGITVTQELISI